jgi:signal transduction histidine kinase
MLHDFLTANRIGLIGRCRTKVAARPSPKATQDELENGIPLFLDQLIKTLRVEQTRTPLRSREVSGPSGGEHAATSEIGEAALLHGRALLKHGFTVDQVVHDYGDLCQAITDCAVEKNLDISTEEFRTLNRCLDNAIAVAVTEFSRERDSVVTIQHELAFNERLGFFAHELRNLLSTVTLSLAAIRTGNVGHGGATGAVLDRSLVALRHLIDRSLTDVRIAAGLPKQQQVFPLAGFMADVAVSATLEANTKGCELLVHAVDPDLAVNGDRELLFSAVGNLLQNAFKFTRANSQVHVRVSSTAARVRIEVEDACGGLVSGDTQTMFLSFHQGGADRTGLGLGLSVARRSVESFGGTLEARDMPGVGCVFTIDLPRHVVSPAQPALAS